ncbi:hypothetical protein JCM11641_004476 [Rhodosporidiobolus odoratus]
MKADSNFAALCPDVDMKTWCLNPPTNGTCCGICPNAGISGLGGHISLAFSSLSSIAAIALSPASAPSSLLTNLIQADAYAVSLLGYLLSDSSGLDFFHAAYALLLALSSLIPLTAIAASPPWAVTGQKSPAERTQEAEQTVLEVLQEMEAGHASSSSSDDDERQSLRRRRKKKRIQRQRLQRVLEDNPSLVLNDAGSYPCCGMPGSHLLLYLGFSVSVLLWGSALYLGVLGGANGSTRVALSQPNCTEGLGSAAILILYADVGFMILAIVIFIATIINHLMNDVARALNREVTATYNGSTRLVFGVSFIVWLVWMGTSFTIYFMAGQANLLAAGEFSWSFGSTFSALMLIVPVYSVLKALWANR